MDRPQSEHYSDAVNDFHGRRLPEPGKPVGYAAVVDRYNLRVPLPPQLAFISKRHVKIATDEWQIFGPRHEPVASLGGHLTFALKWEGVQLGVLAALFKAVEPDVISEVVSASPTGA